MKNIIILLNLVCISQGVFGTYSAWTKDKLKKDLVHKSIRSDSKTAATSSSNIINDNEIVSTSSSVSRKKSRNIKELEGSNNIELPKLDSVTREKIRNFSLNLKSQVYSVQQIEKALTEYASHPNDSIQKIASRNALPSSTLHWWKSTAGFSCRRRSTIQELARKKINPEIREKIRDFSLNMRRKSHSAEQVEKALVEYVTLTDYSIAKIAKTNEIPERTLSGWISKLDLNSRREDRHNKKVEKDQKLINSLNRGVKWKKLHRVVGKRRNATINTLRKLQDEGQIEITLTEDKKNRIIKDYREKVLTNKGIARKHNVKESDVYCVIHEAHRNKKDLSTIKIKWKISYNKYNLISEEQKERMVRDYNKGLLTVQGICVKHEISMKTAQSVIYKENGARIKRRNGKQIRTVELITDIMNKSNREIEKKYGYKSVYIDELKRYVRQWSLLTDDQKNIFKNSMIKGGMPAVNIISSVKKSSINAVNEKFKKMLFVLDATYEDIMDEYGITRKSANKLKRESEFWKILSEKEQKTSSSSNVEE